MQTFTIDLNSDFTFAEIEERLLAAALERHSFNMSRVSESLGVSRATVYKKIHAYFGLTAQALRAAIALEAAGGMTLPRGNQSLLSFRRRAA